MIQVIVDLSQASRAEVEQFYALPGVGRAVDALSHSRGTVLRFRLDEPDVALSSSADARTVPAVLHGRLS